MPIKAEHDEKSTPVVYAVEKDGKAYSMPMTQASCARKV